MTTTKLPKASTRTTSVKTPRRSTRTPASALADLTLKDDQLLTTRQAAAVVGRTPKTLRELRCNRAGPRCLKMGTSKQARTYYRRSDLERWIVENSHVVGGG
jgi:hypothetical protein